MSSLETQTNFNHTFVLDLEQFDPVLKIRIPLNEPFNLTVQIQVVKQSVTIRVPAFNFNLTDPSTGDPIPGFVYTQSNNLPRRLWPADVMPEAFVILSDRTGPGYQLSIGPDGSFNVSALDSSAISHGGGQVLHATTISYLIPCRNKPPKNVRINKKSFSIIGTLVNTVPYTPGGILDFINMWQNDIVKTDDGKIYTAFIFPDTSGVPVPPGRCSAAVRRAVLHHGKFEFGPISIPQVNPPGVFDGESTISINPKNADNMVRATFRNDFNIPVPPTAAASSLVTSYTLDGGKTWTTQVVSPPEVFPFETALKSDMFGNFWLADVESTEPGNFFAPYQFRLWNSADGGKTFTVVFDIVTKDLVGGGVLDFPNMYLGPDGAGGFALWFVYNDVFFFPTETTFVNAGFIRVFGLGDYDPTPITFPLDSIPPNDVSTGQIVVGPTGKVYIGACFGADDSPTPGGGPLADGNRAFLYVNPTGTVGYNANSFGPRQDIYFSNTAPLITPDFSVHQFKPVPWQPFRGIIPIPRGFIGFDNKRNRLYICGWDMRPNLSNKDVVFVIYSENDGQSWSNQFIVNDVVDGSRAMATMAVEPTTGLLSVGFFDPRNHLDTQQIVDYYIAIFGAPNKKLINLPQKNMTIVDKKNKDDTNKNSPNNKVVVDNPNENPLRGRLRRINRKNN